MRIHLGLLGATIAIVAAATGCGGYSSPNEPSGGSTGADSTRDTTSPPPSPYLQR
jgi:hypothetical protein